MSGKKQNKVYWVVLLLVLISCVNQQEEKEADSSTENKPHKEMTNTDKPEVQQQAEYKSVVIGKQTWMAENLDVRHFRNGDTIPHAETADEWSGAAEAKAPAWCYYNNDEKNGDKYGRLYNWYAVNDPRGLAPEGWKVAVKKDWEQLEKRIGNLVVHADKLMSTTGWLHKSGTNETGFNGLPAGGRFLNGEFKYLGENAYFWTSTIEPHDYDDTERAYVFMLNTELPMITGYPKEYGLSVRCIKVSKE